MPDVSDLSLGIDDADAWTEEPDVQPSEARVIRRLLNAVIDLGYRLGGEVARDLDAPCFHEPREVRVIDPDWFGTDKTVGWLRCAKCGQSLCEPKEVGDGPILKEIWEG